MLKKEVLKIGRSGNSLITFTLNWKTAALIIIVGLLIYFTPWKWGWQKISRFGSNAVHSGPVWVGTPTPPEVGATPVGVLVTKESAEVKELKEKLKIAEERVKTERAEKEKAQKGLSDSQRKLGEANASISRLNDSNKQLTTAMEDADRFQQTCREEVRQLREARSFLRSKLGLSPIPDDKQ